MQASPSPLPAPAPFPDPDAALRRNLTRYRRFASGLLVAMAGMMLGSYWLPPGYATDLLQASAKAGLVGGLADWFAVTALFRHPLGIPIPHTAIIPHEKERLGRGLGRFVANHVFTEAELRRVMGRIDVAGILKRVLQDPANTRPAVEAMAASLPRLLLSLEDGRARRLMLRILPRIASGPAASRMLARLLRTLMASGQHQEVFGLALAQIRVLLASKEDSLRTAIEARVRTEGGALVGWLAGAAVARRILGSLNQELERIAPDDSEIRAAFEAWLLSEIERLENDPERAAAIGRALRDAMSHPTVHAWLLDVWDRLKTALANDAAAPGGRSVALLSGLLGNVGELLDQDEAARARVNGMVERMLLGMLPRAQERISGFIAGVVGNWDTATVVDKIELRVGRDLQFVRVNGTIVGFLVGGALYAVLHAVFGRVAG
jgi:uncharacterized membrane-anchored protein YjiN (DUF445 family)